MTGSPLPWTAPQRRRHALLRLAVLLPLGLLWRLAPLHLPQFAFKYGGSALWAAAVYWLLAALLPRWRVVPLALLAVCVATAVEFLKKLRSLPLDHFRETLAGKLLLGRYFTVGALVAYWLSLLLVSWTMHTGQESASEALADSHLGGSLRGPLSR